jgi:beta-N-acetylhexosaminidase
MSLASEKAMMAAGGFLVAGWEGTALSEPLGILERIRPAGLILFRRNYPPGGGPELRGQLAALKEAAGRLGLAPLILCLDNEGGAVKRLPEPHVQLPKASDPLGPDEIKALARKAGAELRGLGFNLNLAPVLDVDVSGALMRERSFGTTPEAAAERAAAFAEGFLAEGVAGCGKHFPGLGAAEIDPHERMPVVKASAGELRGVHMAPFRRLLGRAIPMAMTTHCLYPALDEGSPATFSKKILWELRAGLGFGGPILTDDLEMGAVLGLGPGRAAGAAIEAGPDLALVCRKIENVRAAASALAEALDSGRLPWGRLAESRGRVKEALDWAQEAL